MKLSRFVILVVLLGHALFAHGAEFWQASHGPEGGYIRAFAGDGNTFYAATNGDVFRSVDKGATWTAASSRAPQYVSSLTLAPDGTLYAGTWSGAFKSVDNGATWAAAGSGLSDKAVLALALAPDGTLYAGTDGGGVQSMILPAGKPTRSTLQPSSAIPENTIAPSKPVDAPVR